MNYTIKIWELKNKKEKIIDLQTFSNRNDAEKFIKEKKAELKPYKILKNKPYYTMEA